MSLFSEPISSTALIVTVRGSNMARSIAIFQVLFLTIKSGSVSAFNKTFVLVKFLANMSIRGEITALRVGLNITQAEFYLNTA